MKRVFVLIVVISICILGCSDKSDNSLKVGMDLRFYPFTGMDKEGNPSGVEVDIARALGAYLNKDVEIVNTEFPMLIPALQSEEIDIIIGSMSVTEEREKTVDFSQAYLYEKIVALVNKEFAEENNVSDQMLLEDFFSIEKTNYVGIIGSVAVSIPQSYGYTVKALNSEAVAEREIITGDADVLIGAYTLYGMNNKNKDSTIIYGNAVEVSHTAMAVKEGNKDLLEQVNSFISEMEVSGLNDQLREDWDLEIGKKLFNEKLTLDYYLKLK